MVALGSRPRECGSHVGRCRVPIYRATIHITDSALLGDQDYSFNCHINESGTSDQAWEDANEVAEALVGTVLTETCNVYKVSIHDPDAINGNQSRLVDLPGTRTTTGDVIPPWNVALLQARSSAGARPSSFHLRMGLTENDIVGQNLASATNSAIAALFAAFALINNMCDPTGGLFTAWSCDGQVHMRQMGWHRRTRPGFKRGWVPV